MRWQDECFKQAACRGADPEIFFSGDPYRAKEICRGCPVRAECDEAAKQIEKQTGLFFGVWGGLSKPERERRYR